MKPVWLYGQSLNWFVRQHPTLFHAQDWYRTEPFAGVEYVRKFPPEAEPWPAAAYAAAFVEAAADGEVLWPARYIWTSDTDHEGNRVYIGRAAQYGGLQIHRLLTPEIE